MEINVKITNENKEELVAFQWKGRIYFISQETFQDILYRRVDPHDLFD